MKEAQPCVEDFVGAYASQSLTTVFFLKATQRELLEKVNTLSFFKEY